MATKRTRHHAEARSTVDWIFVIPKLALIGLAALPPLSAGAQGVDVSAPIGGGASGGIATGLAAGPHLNTWPRESYNLGFGLTIQGIASDNFNLAPSDSKVSGRAMELSPFVDGYLRTAQSRGDMSLRLRGLWYSSGGSSDSQSSPDVRANGDLSISGDELRFAGSAYVFRNSPSPFSASSIDPATRSADTELYKAYAVSPYSLGRIGDSDYELRYRGQIIDPGGSELKSTSHQVSGGLTSRQGGASAWGWSAQASAARVTFEDDSDLTRDSGEVLAYYGVTPSLRLGAGVNYSRLDVFRNEDGENSGFGPTGFVSWRPGPRTLLTGKYADTYYGSESSLRMVHRLPGWLFGAQYFKGLQTGTESGLLYFDPNAVFSLPEAAFDDSGRASVRGLADRRMFSRAGQPLSFGTTGSALVFDESLIASVGFVRPRNSILLSVFANNQQPARSTLLSAMASELKQRGASVSLNHRLAPDSSVFLISQYAISESANTNQEAHLTTFTGGWQFNLARRTLLTTSARYSRQTSAGGAPSAQYAERAVIVAVEHRF